MEAKKVRLGSISLLVTVILLCVIVLAVLSISTVRGDLLLAERTADSVSGWYELQNDGQRWLAQVDQVLAQHSWEDCDGYLPEGTSRENDRIAATLRSDGRTLQIELIQDQNTSYRIAKWVESTDWEEDMSLNLFQ
jgi:hypothetical protein